MPIRREDRRAWVMKHDCQCWTRGRADDAPFVLRWRRALSKSDLDPTAKHVGNTLSLWMGSAGTCHPTYDMIAHHASIERTTAYRALVRLRDAGFVTWRTARGRHPNLYFAVIPPVLNRCTHATDDGVQPLHEDTSTVALLQRTRGYTQGSKNRQGIESFDRVLDLSEDQLLQILGETKHEVLNGDGRLNPWGHAVLDRVNLDREEELSGAEDPTGWDHDALAMFVKTLIDIGELDVTSNGTELIAAREH